MAEQRVMDAALKLLAKQDLSRAQLSRKLSKAGFGEEEIVQSLDRLSGWGYLDDRKYGIGRVECFKAKLKSRNYTRMALLDAGLDLNARRRDGTTPLQLALEYAPVEVLETMRAHGAQLTEVYAMEVAQRRPEVQIWLVDSGLVVSSEELAHLWSLWIEHGAASVPVLQSLHAHGFGVAEGDPWTITVPSWRRDVDAARLRTIGLGELRPVGPNAKPDGSDDEEGRQRNRRVEVILPKTAAATAPSSAAPASP